MIHKCTCMYTYIYIYIYIHIHREHIYIYIYISIEGDCRLVAQREMHMRPARRLDRARATIVMRCTMRATLRGTTSLTLLRQNYLTLLTRHNFLDYFLHLDRIL